MMEESGEFDLFIANSVGDFSEGGFEVRLHWIANGAEWEADSVDSLLGGEKRNVQSRQTSMWQLNFRETFVGPYGHCTSSPKSLCSFPRVNGLGAVLLPLAIAP